MSFIHIRLDYWIHAVMFVPWMALAHFRYHGSGTFSVRPLLMIASILFSGILFALFCEALQYFTPWRTFNINDLLANLLGIILGLPAWWLLTKLPLQALTMKK